METKVLSQHIITDIINYCNKYILNIIYFIVVEVYYRNKLQFFINFIINIIFISKIAIHFKFSFFFIFFWQFFV